MNKIAPEKERASGAMPAVFRDRDFPSAAPYM
jgi:hypothetical protein